MSYPESGEGISRHLKGALVDPIEESPKYASAALGSLTVDGVEALGTRTWLVSVVV